jgi:glutathione S-transferase
VGSGRAASRLMREGPAMYRLYIGNKNYSSWSLRPWLAMRELAIAFEEHLLPFGDEPLWRGFRSICPSGKVPCLLDGERSVWESLAIVEYLAERHPALWPQEAAARAWARCAAAEMHAGFAALREQCSMSCGVRVTLSGVSAALEADLARLATLWMDGLQRFGGPFLAGARFGAVDAFYAPIAFRIQSYALALEPVALAYAERLLALPGMRAWYEAALLEPWRESAHEAQVQRFGRLRQDLRAAAGTHMP